MNGRKFDTPMMHLVRSLTIVAAAVLSPCLPGLASAQPYPNKPIKMVVGFPPGGITDIVGRVVADAISKELGQPVIVENKTGATGVLAASTVATSPKDGYTLLLVPGGHALYGAILATLPFDPVDSFEWIGNVITSPFIVAVMDQSPLKSVADIIGKAKANPGAMKFGSAGVGAPNHLAVELLSLATGVKFLHVAYRGEGPVTAALISGEIEFVVTSPPSVLGNSQLRPLAVTTNTRTARLPNVPTVQQELRLDDFNVRSWVALAGPAGIPEPIVARLSAALRKALESPEVRTRLEPSGGDISPTSPKEQRDRVASELQMWTRIVQTAGIPKQ